MERVVLDTNVLVSALWKRPSHPAAILDFVALRQLQPVYSAEILQEYKTVLLRPGFKFSLYDVINLIDLISKEGLSFIAPPSSLPFIDESDRKFYDISKSAHAYLITGNKKHYPNEEFVLSPASFVEKLNKSDLI